jgi:hypothetical protein
VNVTLAMFGQQKDAQSMPAIPQELYRIHKEAVQHIAAEMRRYSVSKLVLDLNPNGAIPLAAVSWKTLDDSLLPAQLKHARPRVLRALQIYLELFGIHTVGITLSDTEITELHNYWEYLRTGAANSTDNVLKDIPLHFERDPTNAVVASEDR